MEAKIVDNLVRTEIDLNKMFSISSQCMRNVLLNKQPISQEYYDAAMSSTALDNLQVMLGPRTSVAQETIVKALLNQYAPKSVLKHSELKLRK